MFLKHNNVFVTSLLLVLSLPLRAVAQTNNRLTSAKSIAEVTYDAFMNMFMSCIQTHIPSKQFKIDNVKGFINYPSRTTVGSGPKVTGNRKFFANVVSTRGFKEMLEQDVDDIRTNYIKKMKYCDNVVMDREIIKDFYDREVDQTKI